MADSLSKYQSMRDFSATPEPKGKVKRTKGATYIVQKHDATRLHWDFRLELDGVLLSWAVTRGPSLNPKDKRLAVRTEDHPVDYAGFEGVIPSGYGAGTVMLWDRGQWAPQEDPHEGLKKGSLKIVLNGERLKGGFALVRLKPKPGEKKGRENWLLIKERDQWADESFVATDEWTDSVKSGLDFKGIEKGGEKYKRGKAYKPGVAAKAKPVKKAAKKPSAKKAAAKAKPRARARKTAALKSKSADRLDGPRAVPRFVAPELVTLVDGPPVGPEWVHEIKFDGYRIIAVVKKNKVQLWTRNELDWTHKYASIAKALEGMKLGDCTLDGELVALGENGQGEFSLMQGAAENDKAKLVYYVFDLLNDGGQDIRKLQLVERKERLKALVDGAPEVIRYSEHIDGSGVEVIASACGLKLEGVISKRRDTPYTSGRGRDWVKSKCTGNDEFVIVGYRKSDKRGRAFASLLLGEYVDDQLVYRGRVGTGFDDAVFEQLSAKFHSRERKSSALVEVPAEAKRDVVWLKPDLVAQIEYTEQTPDGRLRHPSYLGLREDKEAVEVTSAKRAGTIRGADAKKAPAKKVAKAVAKKAVAKAKPKAKAAPPSGDPEQIDGVRLTSPDKVLWPDVGVTKQMLAEYYARMAKHILPFVKDRPLSLVRCPEGIAGECFFQKHHVMSTPDEIGTVPIEEKDGETKDYLVIRDAKGLVAAAQIGGLELHVWGVRSDMIEKPERVIFDLDPDEGLSFKDVKAAAFEIRDLLDAAGLKSFPLLTGGKGIHVITPLGRRNEWPEVKAFARGFATKVAAAAPDRYVAGASKAKRKGKIFIDWLRNERGSTAVAPFSVRARKGAPVATPVSWTELQRIDSASTWSIETIEGRLRVLKSDPWKGYATTRQTLSAGLREMFE